MHIYLAHPADWMPNIEIDNVIPINFQILNAGGAEYEMFKMIFNQKHDDFWGVLSWKFDIKSPVPLKQFNQFCITEFKKGADCVFINPMLLNEALFASPWEQGIVCGHNGLDEIYSYLLDKALISEHIIGINHFAFCNYFVANDIFWTEYFTYVDEVLNLLTLEAKNRTVIGDIFSGTASYSKNQNLTMQPFIVERLFSSFIRKSSLKIVPYKFLEEDYVRKFGMNLGLFCKKMSALKNDGINYSDKNKIEIWNSKRIEIIKDRNILITAFNMDDISLKFT